LARPAPHRTLSPYDLLDLRRLANAPSTPQGLAFRARVVLRGAQPDKPRNDHGAREGGGGPKTVSKWRWRCRRGGFAGLYDLPRGARPAPFPPRRPPPGDRPGHDPARRRGRPQGTLVAR